MSEMIPCVRGILLSVLSDLFQPILPNEASILCTLCEGECHLSIKTSSSVSVRCLSIGNILNISRKSIAFNLKTKCV